MYPRTTKALGRTAFALLIGMAVCLAAATFVEKTEGSEFAARHIYRTGWFAAWWALIAASALPVAVVRIGPGKRAAVALHLSLGLILFGALLTFATSQKGYVHLRERTETACFRPETGGEARPLPFSLRLERFEIECYPGTQAPADYRSLLTVVDSRGPRQAVVSMNHILSRDGYRLYQTSFDEDMRGSILSVNRDPYGTPVTYAGYLLLGVSMIGTLCSKRSGFRRLLRHPLLKRAGFLLLFASVCCGASAGAPATLDRETADALGRLRMLYGGRVAPVQSFARDLTVKICGKPAYGKYTAEQVLAGWIFFPEQWQHEPMIRIKQDTVRKLLGSGATAALTDFFGPGRSYRLAEAIRHGADLGDPAHRAFAEADEKIQLIAMIQSGRVLRLFPEQGENGTQWYAPTDPVRALPKGDSVFIKGIFPLMYEAVRNGDSDGLRGLIDKTAAFQRERGAAGFLPEGRLKAELLYNRLDAVPWLYRIDLCCGLLAFAYFVWSLASGRRNRRIERLSLVPLAGTAVLLTVSMALRGYAAGHLPLSNGYETMIFVAWCLSLLALGIGRRFPIAAASGLLMSGFALLVASLGMANPQITPLVPVLRSPWLSLHVSLIMVSYALLGLLMLNGTAALALAATARTGTSERTSRTLARLRLFGQLLLYPAVFLLTAGIFTGAVWANASWGRYWGWDPKEVWALITLIVYALPLHGQSLARFRRPLFFHAYTLWAFAAVLMTYFGVNYLLGGMHSYGGGFRPGYAAATVFAAVTAFALLTVAALIRQRRTDA
ncbi:cytochrome c biogenesis protein CcsA [Alistipes ihumii]|uniref:cytochrome c biogenesis protein CcsA n=1 Tax=Alistipes ihumii TaxID=1470347 RepID=UPI00307B7BE9